MSLDIRNTTLPLPYLTSWIKAGSQCDINALDIFEAMGIQLDLDNIQHATISPVQLLKALQDCTRAAKEREKAHYPLALGEAIVFDHSPAAEAFLASSPSIRQALNLIEWIMPQINPWLKVQLHENDSESWITFEHPFVNSDAPPLRYVTESTMSAFMHIGFTLLGNKAHKPLAVHFRHAKPIYHQEYPSHFLVEPCFGQTRNALFFARHFLDQPLPGAKIPLHEQALSILKRQHPKGATPQPFCQQVIDRLVDHPELLTGDLNSIAQTFGLSSRTFQRRLSTDGLGFSDALKTAQRLLATRWLTETTLDINTISTQLGYQSRRAFTNAFKQWTGRTPTDFRAHEDSAT
jgi:AraC-like DNA-binding protein